MAEATLIVETQSLSRLARPGQVDGRRNRHCQEHRTSCNQEREHRSIPFSRQGHDEVDTNVAGERCELFHTMHTVVAPKTPATACLGALPRNSMANHPPERPRPSGDFFVRFSPGCRPRHGMTHTATCRGSTG